MKSFSLSSFSRAACVNIVSLPAWAPGASSAALTLFTATTSTPRIPWTALIALQLSETMNSGPLVSLYGLPRIFPIPARTFLVPLLSSSFPKPSVSSAFWTSFVLSSFSKSVEIANG